MYRNYEALLLYVIQHNWNKYVKNKFTILQNFVPMERYYEIKLDYCLSEKNSFKFLEDKLKKQKKDSSSRLNGYWCKNPIKTNPQKPGINNLRFFCGRREIMVNYDILISPSLLIILSIFIFEAFFKIFELIRLTIYITHKFS
ncbi:hypothetical protein HZS_7541 [Henneguya salminicola]|nr:hypothetical protein HZS_7541 [Henneguya salminicola]